MKSPIQLFRDVPLLALLCITTGIAADAPAPTNAPTTGPAGKTGAIAPAAPATAPVVPAAPPKHQPVAPPPPPPVQPVAPVNPPAAASTNVQASAATGTQPVVVPTTQPLSPPAAQAISPTAPPAVMPTTQPGPLDEKVAYAIGYSVGSRIKARLAEDGRDANDLQILNGIIAGMDNREPAYPREDIAQAFAEFQEYTLTRRAEKQYAQDPAFRKLADDNLQKSHALLAQNAEVAGVDSLPDGVQLQVIKPGTGRVLGNAKLLTVNLKVSLADGTLVKSSEPNKPEKISVADCLPALIDASRGMKVGSTFRVLLPPDKAYGLAGKPPVIGPNEAIEYEIDLLGVE